MDAAGTIKRLDEAPASPQKSPIEASAGFVSWMIRNRVSLAFTSFQNGDLYFLGSQSDGRAVFSRAQIPYAMGLAASAQRIYLAANMQIWRLENILKADELANDRHDRLFVPRNAHVIGPLDPHELSVEPSGRILFANTRYARVATPSLTHAFKSVWKPTFITKLAPEDRCHLNGIGLEEGRLRYFTTCSTTDMVDGWREHRAHGGVVIDVNDDRIVAEGLSMPHSPRVHRGSVWVLDSGRGHLCRIDAKSGVREAIGFYPGFLRGLAFTDNFAVATLSLPRTARFEGLELDGELARRKASPRCGIIIVDIRNGDVVEWLRFTREVKELFDIALIPNVRCPRGLALDSVTLKDAISVEDAALN